jgi:hypothetical protein
MRDQPKLVGRVISRRITQLLLNAISANFCDDLDRSQHGNQRGVLLEGWEFFKSC